MDSAASMLITLDTATERLLATVTALDDAALAAPSLLPRWSRAHVLAHLARNAESHIRLLDGLVQYSDAGARAQDIEVSSRAPRGTLLADLRGACADLAARFTAETDWAADRAVDDPRPREVLIGQRLLEVEVHHVDLDAGYLPAHWPAGFVGSLLDNAAASMAEASPLRLVADDGPGTWMVGAGAGVLEVRGAAHALAAWLIGRSPGTGVEAVGGGALPTPSAWR